MNFRRVVISFICLFLFQSLSNAVEVQVTITGHVDWINESGAGVGSTGVSEGDPFDLVFQYNLEKGEFKNWVDNIRQAYAGPFVNIPHSGMSAALNIGSTEWILLSENCDEAKVELDQRELLSAQQYLHYMRVMNDDVTNYPAHIYDSGISFLLNDDVLPYELYDEFQIPTQTSDINFEAIDDYDLKFWSLDKGDNPWDNSWYIELTYESVIITTIPEPATLLLLGLGSLALLRKRRK